MTGDMSAGDSNTAGRHYAHGDALEVHGAGPVPPPRLATATSVNGNGSLNGNGTASGQATPAEPSSPSIAPKKPPGMFKRTWSREDKSPALGPDSAATHTSSHQPPSAQEFTQMLIDEQTALPALPDPVVGDAGLEPDADEEISDKLSERRFDMPEPKDLVNRELSWIEFNKRVLGMAEREDLPLLERLKFLAIFSSNLDEFFEVRVGRLLAMERDIPHLLSQESLTPSEQLSQIRARLPPAVEKQIQLFRDLRRLLEGENVYIRKWDQLSAKDHEVLSQYFEENVMDALTPLSVDSSHPFAYVSNLSLNIGFSILDPQTAQEKFARVKVPMNPRLVNLSALLAGNPSSNPLPTAETPAIFVPMEEIIYGNAEQLFRGMKITGRCVFRLTRHADLGLYGDIEGDLREVIESETKKHRRAEPAIRLEIDFPGKKRKEKREGEGGSETPRADTPRAFSVEKDKKEKNSRKQKSRSDMLDEEEEELSAEEKIIQLLMSRLKIKREDVYNNDWGLMDLTCLWALMRIDRPDLKSSSYTPRIPKALDFDHTAAPHKFFDLLNKKGDLMCHLPYESFPASVEAFVESASLDPDVIAIKMTLYRTSDGENPLIKALIRAAEAGKHVVVLLELKARFNEMSNVFWSRALEQAGVHVVYGVEGLKTHAKITLVIRREGKQMKRYVHASTGNYNRKTATIYEDLTYFTADPKIGEDAVDLFNYLTGYSRFQDYNSLIVAPLLMRRKIMELIEEQAAKGDDGQIFIKCNSITDPGIIAGLYRASQAGCWVDIVVRGVCCLKPGVEGLSTNIRVRSIIGKYLEHSRIYKFGDGDEQQVYIGSADLMHRNISRRCEILIPITSTRLRARLDEIIRTCLYDEHLAWELKEESWTWVNGDAEKDTHQIFEKVYEHQVMTKTAKKKKLLFVDDD